MARRLLRGRGRLVALSAMGALVAASVMVACGKGDPPHTAPAAPNDAQARPTPSASMETREAPTPASSSSSSPCPKTAPADLVIRLDRVSYPHGAEVHEEAGEVTHAGTCSPGTTCVRVDEPTLARLYAAVRRIAEAPTREVHRSPHYTSRTLTARFAGGSCWAHDGARSPIALEFLPAFDATFRAVSEPLERASDAGVR